MIVIVDYGLGNLGSVKNMIAKLGFEAIISCEINHVREAEKLILAGVGSFDMGMTELEKRGLVEPLSYKVLQEKIPILGICLGMQLMTNRSEEGIKNGLSWINAETVKFPNNELIVPHMGWNNINILKPSKLFMDSTKDNRFYFVHSYFVQCFNNDDILCETVYGSTFHSAFERANIYGVQFHPEKSHKYGMEVFKGFLNID